MKQSFFLEHVILKRSLFLKHVIPKRSLFLKHVIPKRSLPRSQFAGSRVPDTARDRQDPVGQHDIFNTSSQEEGRVCGGSVAFDQVGSIRPSNNDPGESQGGMVESSAKQEDQRRHGARQTSWPSSRCYQDHAVIYFYNHASELAVDPRSSGRWNSISTRPGRGGAFVSSTWAGNDSVDKHGRKSVTSGPESPEDQGEGAVF